MNMYQTYCHRLADNLRLDGVSFWSVRRRSRCVVVCRDSALSSSASRPRRQRVLEAAGTHR